jgi:hypothetical protein
LTDAEVALFATSQHLRRLLVLVVALSGCTAAPTRHIAPTADVTVTGTIEEVCLACSEALLTTGGALLWDVLTVRVSAPDVYAGSSVSVEVLIADVAQRSAYPEGRVITFSAAPEGMEQHRILLHASNIHGR